MDFMFDSRRSSVDVIPAKQKMCSRLEYRFIFCSNDQMGVFFFLFIVFFFTSDVGVAVYQMLYIAIALNEILFSN